MSIRPAGKSHVNCEPLALSLSLTLSPHASESGADDDFSLHRIYVIVVGFGCVAVCRLHTARGSRTWSLARSRRRAHALHTCRRIRRGMCGVHSLVGVCLLVVSVDARQRSRALSSGAGWRLGKRK